jgi:PAS domain S-box-containing protein
MCRITGYTPDEMVGQTPRVLQGNGTSREKMARLRADLAANRPCLVEVTNYRKDGTPYEAEIFVTPLFNTEGLRTNFVSIHRDITERKRAKEALRREHALSEGIIESAQHIILLLDTEGRIVRFNAYMEELTGYRLPEVQGHGARSKANTRVVRPRAQRTADGRQRERDRRKERRRS